MELIDEHSEMLNTEFDNFDDMDNKQKIEALKEIYDQAVDIENAEKAIYMDKISKDMHGKVMN